MYLEFFYVIYLDLFLNWPDPLLLPSLPTQLHVLLPTLSKKRKKIQGGKPKRSKNQKSKQRTNNKKKIVKTQQKSKQKAHTHK